MPKQPLSKKQLDDAFGKYDTNKDGKVSIHELMSALENNCNLSRDQILGIMVDIDVDGDQQMSYTEFEEEMCKKPREEGINEFFAKTDKDGSGSVSWDEIKEVLSTEPCWDEAEMKKCFDNADTDGSGCVNKEEFKESMKNCY